jgi:hypothetical protein
LVLGWVTPIDETRRFVLSRVERREPLHVHQQPPPQSPWQIKVGA